MTKKISKMPVDVISANTEGTKAVDVLSELPPEATNATHFLKKKVDQVTI